MGCSAARACTSGTLLAYTLASIIRPDADIDYTWAYPSSSGRYGIDGKHAGNHLRFVNHDKQRVNRTVEYVPIDKKWFVVYVADRHLEVGEQVLVNYGSRSAARRKGFTNGTY